MIKVYKKYRRGIRAVIYKKDKKGFLFLVLHRIKRWKGYELLKGGKFSKETYFQALKREIKEETDCRAESIKKLPIKDKFDYPQKHILIFKRRGQISVCYVCELSCLSKIKLVDEHDKYYWLDFKRALRKLSYGNSKKILRYANSFLRNAK